MINTIDFVDDLKQYLKASITTLDSDFSSLETYTAYTYEHTPKAPEIDIYINDDSDDETSNSFDGENISNISLNIYCYADAMKLNGSNNKTSAVETTTLLAQYVKDSLKKNTIISANSNIISSTRTAYTGAMNVRDTVLYVAILRYDFKVRNNYTKVYLPNHKNVRDHLQSVHLLPEYYQWLLAFLLAYITLYFHAFLGWILQWLS